MASSLAEQTIESGIDACKIGIGKNLLQKIGEIAPIIRRKPPQTAEVVAGKLYARPPAGFQLITEMAQRKLCQVLTVQFELKDFPTKHRHLDRPFSSDVVGIGSVDPMTKLPSESTKRACRLGMP